MKRVPLNHSHTDTHTHVQRADQPGLGQRHPNWSASAAAALRKPMSLPPRPEPWRFRLQVLQLLHPRGLLLSRRLYTPRTARVPIPIPRHSPRAPAASAGSGSPSRVTVAARRSAGRGACDQLDERPAPPRPVSSLGPPCPVPRSRPSEPTTAKCAAAEGNGVNNRQAANGRGSHRQDTATRRQTRRHRGTQSIPSSGESRAPAAVPPHRPGPDRAPR